MNLYPNPAKDLLFLDIPLTSQLQDLIVYDLLGQSQKIIYTNQQGKLTVTLENELATGVYFIQAILENGEKAVTRFMKE